MTEPKKAPQLRLGDCGHYLRADDPPAGYIPDMDRGTTFDRPVYLCPECRAKLTK